MKNRNRNSKGFLWYFFTLFSFGLGVLLYILIKRGKKSKGKVFEKDVNEPVKKDVSKKDLNKIDEVVLKELNNRQKYILQYLIDKGKIDSSCMQDLAPDVSIRTLRRDMDKFEELKLVEQKGSTKSTYYKYIGK